MRQLLSVWFCILMVAMLVSTIPMVGIAGPIKELDVSDEGNAYILQSALGAGRYAEVITKKGTLNMRREPKDGTKVIHRIPRGTIICITDDLEDWTEILYKGNIGYVQTNFLEEVMELPYEPITKEDKGDRVLNFKKGLHKLGYIKSEEINMRFDATLEVALVKLQLLNNIPLNKAIISEELQALMEWGLLAKHKSGYINTTSSDDSDLSVTIFCWDSGGMLYEDDKSVKVSVSYAAQATGGQAPYKITVKKSLGAGGVDYADPVDNPFSYIWSPSTDVIYVYATVEDAAGNTVTACTPFRYVLPARYME